MDGAVMWIAIVVALTILAFFLNTTRKRGKQKTNFNLNVAGVVSAQASTSNGPDAGVVVTDATSKDGGLIATDGSGRGVQVERVEAEGNIILHNAAPPGSESPKA